ncbi:MAG: hypothetical protein ABSG13_29465 [Bryobacteraceae bacterium]|jgi:hypothetical protein
MENTSELERKECERITLLAEATQIVQVAEAQSRAITADEDARVLELMARVQGLEEQIGHLKRHEHKPDATQVWSENQG